MDTPNIGIFSGTGGGTGTPVTPDPSGAGQTLLNLFSQTLFKVANRDVTYIVGSGADVLVLDFNPVTMKVAITSGGQTIDYPYTKA